jgi:hypothetical protein
MPTDWIILHQHEASAIMRRKTQPKMCSFAHVGL